MGGYPISSKNQSVFYYSIETYGDLGITPVLRKPKTIHVDIYESEPLAVVDSSSDSLPSKF